MKRDGQRGGSTLIEFTLVGIPMMFVLISIFELSRGMWTYHTLASAIKAGARYTVVHGQNCTIAPNACTVTIAQIAGRIRSAGPGLLPDQLNLTFTPATGSAISCPLGGSDPSACLTNTTTWPPTGANSPGQDVMVSGTYPFRSIISMLWPGAGHSTVGTFAATNFGAVSKEQMQF
jgi:Flp pilus assembly protein TadG